MRARASVSLRALVGALALGGLAGCPPKAPLSMDPQYSIVLLDERAGAALGLNNQGEAVGYIELPDERRRAALWRTNGSPKVVDLGLLKGTSGESAASAINDASQVVGFSDVGWNTWHAFLWSAADGMKDLGTLGGSSRSSALDINFKGTVVGLSDRAFIWDSAEGMRILPNSEPDSFAAAINPSGTVVGSIGYAYGSSTLPPPEARGWTSSSSFAIPNTLGGKGSMAHHLNVYGDVVGKAQAANGDWYPFRWTPSGSMTNLGNLGGCHAESETVTYCGVAEAINASGDVVGTASDANGHLRAVLWRKGKLFDLNGRFSPQSDWVRLEWAMDINVDGHIVGFGYRAVAGGWRRSPFLLRPK